MEYRKLIRGLQHPESFLKAHKALVEIGEPAVPLLIKFLKDRDSSLAAAEVLKEIGAPGIHHLVAALKEKEVSAYAAMILEDIGQPSVEPLIEALTIPDRRVQILTTRALGKLGDDRAIKPILSTLKDFILDDAGLEVAKEALESLGYRFDESGEVSLDEFIEGLVQRDFEILPRGRSVYQNSKSPNYRFVVKDRVVRLERIMVDKSRKWERVRSFSIRHDLHLALAFADSIIEDNSNLEMPSVSLKKPSVSLRKPSVSSAAQKEFSSFAKRPLRITCAVVIGMIVLPLIIYRPFLQTRMKLDEFLVYLLFIYGLVIMFTYIKVRKIHRKCPLCGGRIRLEKQALHGI